MIPLTTIEAHAAREGRRAAVVDDHQTTTWCDYADRVRHLADVLATQLDCDVHNRAVLIGENSTDYVMTASALSTLGVPWVGLDPRGTRELIGAQLREVAPTVVVASATAYRLLADELRTLPDEAVLASFAASAPALALASAAVPPALSNLAADEQASARWRKPPFLALGFTSGTTGAPKLALRTNPSEQRRAETLVGRYGFAADDAHLVTVPFSHASGHGWARLFLTVGATVVLTDDARPSRLVDLAAAHAIRTTLMVPPVLAGFVAAAEHRPSADLSALRFVLTGGRPLHPRMLRRAVDRLGPVITTYYGTTETGVNLIADPADLAAKPASAGTPLPGNHVLVLDPQRRPMRGGDTGRVALSSYMAMTGYARDDAATVEHDGMTYFLTGDYGRLDADGQLTLTNRDDGLPAAHAVPALPVEADLLEIAGVEDAAVVRTPAPHPAGQPTVHAAIAIAAGASAASAVGRARSVLRRRLAPATPGVVSVVPAIPYSRTGKVRTPELRELIASTYHDRLQAA
jgi:acyl-coenzyme A synthetase/AMP-(fatty) acid ligase